jgi:type IV secretion system protein VirB6
MPGEATDFFQSMDKLVMNTIESSTQGKMAFYAGLFSTLIQASITIYMLVQGYRIMAGKLQRPVEDTVFEVGKMGIIIAFLQNGGGYLDLAINALDGLKTGLSGSDNVWLYLDQLWFKAQQISGTLLDLDSSTYVKMEGGIGSILVWAGVLVALLLTTIVFLSAEITILLLTVTAPVFIFCLMFGFLRTMFNNWLQSIFSSILTLMFATLVLSSGIKYLNGVLETIKASANESNLITMGAMAGAAGVICAFVVWLSSKFAAQLAGVGLEGAVQGMAAVGLSIGGFGAAKAAGGVMRGTVNAGRGAIEGSKGTSWKQRESSGLSASTGYGAGRVGRAVVQKVIARNNSRAS